MRILVGALVVMIAIIVISFTILFPGEHPTSEPDVPAREREQTLPGQGRR